LIYLRDCCHVDIFVLKKVLPGNIFSFFFSNAIEFATKTKCESQNKNKTKNPRNNFLGEWILDRILLRRKNSLKIQLVLTNTIFKVCSGRGFLEVLGSERMGSGVVKLGYVK
jgi:hypothetical protein